MKKVVRRIKKFDVVMFLVWAAVALVSAIFYITIITYLKGE